MSDAPHLLVDQDGAILIAILNRPEKLNLLTAETMPLSCDFRLAAKSATYAFPEGKFGSLPASKRGKSIDAHRGHALGASPDHGQFTG